MVLTKTHSIESELLNPTRMRGPSVAHVRDFFGFFYSYKSASNHVESNTCDVFFALLSVPILIAFNKRMITKPHNLFLFCLNSSILIG